jgi:enoyl-CoA hydratase/carnithine racemase
MGSALEIFANGKFAADTAGLVDEVFGKPNERGALVISGANGIVGAGKAMQLGARLQPFNIPIIALDFPGVPDGITRQFPGLLRAFGQKNASRIMENILCFNYDGSHLPAALKKYQPRFLLEAIPEILPVKKSHYKIFQDTFPGIEIRSVTSGFPSSQLGVGITHPAFPHEINKVWEVVEEKPSAITHLFWALGMVPVPVSDHWSFVLDVLFCGLTLAGLRYHRMSNMPFWKIDKYIRRLLGPNPYRAHDVIGAKGANFLTWSCLHHLAEHYGELFRPTPELDERKDSGQNWYPLNHFRPLVNWTMSDIDEEEFRTWILGPLFQMTSLMIHENRSHLSHINAMGELCAQFRNGILCEIRSLGPEATIGVVERYHRLQPLAAEKSWHPEVFEKMGSRDWQQLYVNAQHDGKIGVITISRESYNREVDGELNRAIDWLKKAGIQRVIVSGDFHLSTQMVGADTSDFFPALNDRERGFEISKNWSETARRLYHEFQVSVGFINGKRCLGGMLELLHHCHYLIAQEDAVLGMPEATLPVVPGMEGCHWPFRKTNKRNWPRLLRQLLEGRTIKAGAAEGWLVDFAGPLEEGIRLAWQVAGDGDHSLKLRRLEEGALKEIPRDTGDIGRTGDSRIEATRDAIFKCIQDSCSVTLAEALEIQARHSAEFMGSIHCQKGRIGADYSKTMKV